MNVVWTKDAVRRFDAVDIAVAVATNRGLLTPVVRDAARRSLSAVSADVSALAERARLGRLTQREIEGGSFCISNLGMFGTEEFSAIINPPQSAILAVGAALGEHCGARRRARDRDRHAGDAVGGPPTHRRVDRRRVDAHVCRPRRKSVTNPDLSRMGTRTTSRRPGTAFR